MLSWTVFPLAEIYLENDHYHEAHGCVQEARTIFPLSHLASYMVSQQAVIPNPEVQAHVFAGQPIIGDPGSTSRSSLSVYYRDLQ